MNLNKVFLIGRLTKDPEIKTLPSGKTLCQISIATDRFYTDKEGNKRQETEFHNVILFGRLSEIASQYLKKGSLVFIEGRLRTRNWEDEAGNKRSRTEIIAERMQLGPKAALTKEELPPIEEEKEEIPIIEEEEEINIEDIPF
jgi:single-strand DNA-binding protein